MTTTYGLELELADWNRNVKIPPEWGVIDRNDTTIVNSDGTAVNPYLWYGEGGEICLTPSDNVTEAVSKCLQIFSLLGNYSYNYSCWMHIHIGLPWFDIGDLSMAKIFLACLNQAAIQIKDYTTITSPKTWIAMKPHHRVRRNLTRTTVYSDSVVERALIAPTPSMFWNSLIGVKRPMINIRSLLYHGTIEFRFFHMTNYLEEIADSIIFCHDLTYQIVKYGEADVPKLLYNTPYKFPQPQPFVEELEEGWERTRVPNQPKVDNFTGEVLNENCDYWTAKVRKDNTIQPA